MNYKDIDEILRRFLPEILRREQQERTENYELVPDSYARLEQVSAMLEMMKEDSEGSLDIDLDPVHGMGTIELRVSSVFLRDDTLRVFANVLSECDMLEICEGYEENVVITITISNLYKKKP